jgi:hypothetical protein
MKIFFLIFFYSLSVFAESLSNNLGEIIDISSEGIVTFYRGDIDLQEGEELLVKGKGAGVHLVRVTKVTDSKAMADYLGYQVFGGGMIRKLELGDQVRVEAKRVDQMYMDIILGRVQGSSDFGFQGSGPSLGMDVGGYFTELISWDIRLQADSWGKDPSGVELRRSSYLLGLGYNPGKLRLKGFVGTIDTMTILDAPRPAGYTNPYSGKTYFEEKAHSHNQFGYLVSLGYVYEFKEISRTQRFTWFLQPQVTYSNVFGSGPYPSHWMAGVSFGFTNSQF